MSLKRPHQMQAVFSMASMTDIIFLLLVFFMATSTFVFPTAMEITLPQSTEQTSLKPATRVYIDSIGNLAAAYADDEIIRLADDDLPSFLEAALARDTAQTSVAIYADKAVPYGRVVDILNIGSSHSIKMVLATTPSQK